MDENIREELILRSLKKERLSLKKATENSLFYMDELARFLTYGCDDADDFIAKFRRLQADSEDKLFDKKAYPAADFLTGGEVTHRACFVAYLCKKVCSVFEEKGMRVKVQDFFDGELENENKVAYARGAVTDMAFRTFDKLLGGASVVYTDSFSAACEEVYYGRVPLCILPCETSGEGVLSSFSRLVKKYELYEQCVCSCQTEAGTTKMALLGRTPCLLPITGAMKLLFKASFYAPSFYTFAKITSAAAALGLTVEKADTVPLSWDDARQGAQLTFSGDGENITHFLLYLTVEAPECSDKSVFYEI